MGRLAVSLAVHVEGKPAEADAWREKASRWTARTPTPSAPPPAPRPVAAVAAADRRRDVVANNKALLVAALAVRFPQQKTELAELARCLNVGRRPPHRLVEQALEGRR